MNGLSDKTQAIITLIASVLIGVGAVSIPAGFPLWAGLALAVAGAVGLALKEALGIHPQPPA